MTLSIWPTKTWWFTFSLGKRFVPVNFLRKRLHHQQHIKNKCIFLLATKMYRSKTYAPLVNNYVRLHMRHALAWQFIIGITRQAHVISGWESQQIPEEQPKNNPPRKYDFFPPTTGIILYKSLFRIRNYATMFVRAASWIIAVDNAARCTGTSSFQLRIYRVGRFIQSSRENRSVMSLKSTHNDVDGYYPYR